VRRRFATTILPLAAVALFVVALWIATTGFSLSPGIYTGPEESHHARCHAPIHGAWGHGFRGHGGWVSYAPLNALPPPDLNAECVHRARVRLGLAGASIGGIVVLAVVARRLDRSRAAQPTVDG
jgi:hypothetical protein